MTAAAMKQIIRDYLREVTENDERDRREQYYQHTNLAQIRTGKIYACHEIIRRIGAEKRKKDYWWLVNFRASSAKPSPKNYGTYILDSSESKKGVNDEGI